MARSVEERLPVRGRIPYGMRPFSPTLLPSDACLRHAHELFSRKFGSYEKSITFVAANYTNRILNIVAPNTVFYPCSSYCKQLLALFGLCSSYCKRFFALFYPCSSYCKSLFILFAGCSSYCKPLFTLFLPCSNYCKPFLAALPLAVATASVFLSFNP